MCAYTGGGPDLVWYGAFGIRSYPVSSRNHGRRSAGAIKDALTGTPWMPPAPS